MHISGIAYAEQVIPADYIMIGESLITEYNGGGRHWLEKVQHQSSRPRLQTAGGAALAAICVRGSVV